MERLQMTKAQGLSFAEKLLNYPQECQRRAAEGESPLSLMCWLSTLAGPLTRALDAEKKAFAGRPINDGDKLITFAVEYAPEPVPPKRDPETRPSPPAPRIASDPLMLTKKGLL